jgi:hypothetical protein
MASRIFRQTALDRLSSPEQLDQLVRVVKPQGWAVLCILSGLLAAGLLWGWLGSIPLEAAGEGTLDWPDPVLDPEAGGPSGKPMALLILSADEGRRVAPGMEAHILPRGLSNNAYGFIRGQVRQVGTVTGDGSRTKVGVALERDPRAPTGYLWSASHGPGRELPRGTRITGRIVLQRSRPLTLLIPGLRRLGDP